MVIGFEGSINDMRITFDFAVAEYNREYNKLYVSNLKRTMETTYTNVPGFNAIECASKYKRGTKSY